MKLIRQGYMLIMIAGLLSVEMMFGQSPYDPSLSQAASLLKEQVEVFTDRSIYVVDESIRFKAEIDLAGSERGVQWSSVLYVELVSSSGSSVTREKFPVSSGICKGSLPIPPAVLSGNYFLKCYTRWMRNFDPALFSYTPLTLINPFRSEVMDHPNGNGEEQEHPRRLYREGSMVCESSTPVAGRGEDMQIRLGLSDHVHLQQLNCCISVVPEGAVGMEQGQLLMNERITAPGDFQVEFLPEPRGASISGSVVQSGEPQEFVKVHFTMLGARQDYYVTFTDEFGRFALSMPDHSGTQELFVSPGAGAGSNTEVRIDQDFHMNSLPLPFRKFELIPREKEVARQMAVRKQIAISFAGTRQVAEMKSEIPRDSLLPFYGSSVYQVELEDWVDLPTLEEVFINLVPHVNVIRRKGRKFLKVEGENNAMEVYDPLLIIDHIPVFDQHGVMSVSPEKIKRIDVINEVYVKGDVSYGGIISLQSHKDDMAGIDLPEGSYFFDFQSLQSTAPLQSPSYGPGDRVPDTRNTVLWLDNVLLKRDSLTEIPMNAPLNPGNYSILVRAIARPGEVLSATARFSVQ